MEESSQDNTRLLEEQSDHATPHTADIDQSTSSLDPRAELHILSSEHRHLGYYDASAKSPFPIRSAQRRMEDRMIDTLSLHASQWVLNVGCGSGLTACRLVEEANLTVIAIDTDPKHVKETIKNIARQYVGARMIVSEANYQNLRYEDNSFDGVCGLECFGYATDPSLAIREFARVLNPGGRLVLHTVIEVVSRESENEPHHESSTSPLAADYYSSLTESNISTLLKQSDLIDISIADISANVMPMVKWMAGLTWAPDHLIARPLSWISGSKAEGSKEGEGSGIPNTCTARTLWKMFKSGRAKYVVISATKKGNR